MKKYLVARFLRPLWHMWSLAFFIVATMCWMASCSSVDHIGEGEMVLRNVKITSDQKQVSPGDYRMYVRQEPNAKWFSLVKVPLGIYCMSGSDTTKYFNRLLHRIGEAPVVYSQDMTEHSARSLQIAMQGRGYIHAWVDVDTVVKDRKVDLTYRLHPGNRWYVSEIHRRFDDSTMQAVVQRNASASHLYKGMPLSISMLEAEQKRIVRQLRDDGYYKVNKDYITYSADTTLSTGGVSLTLHFARPAGVDSLVDYRTHTLRNVNLFEDVKLGTADAATSHAKGLTFHYKGKQKIRQNTYCQRVQLHPDSLFRESLIQATYAGLNNLPALDFSTIQFTEAKDAQLDANVYVRSGKKHAVSIELEGTNTSGDLGAAVVAAYSNRNLFRGAETFTFKARGAYEAITGLEGYHNQNYIGFSVEGGIKFPTILFPFLKDQRRGNLNASSEVSMMYDSQNRPEFHRRLVTADWGYRWVHQKRPQMTHRFDLLSINYVFMPWISETFRHEYLEGNDPHYAILRYSYEDLLIMKMGYSFVYNSLKNKSALGLYHTNGYQVRVAAETAGNLLQAISTLTHANKNENGQHKCFNIAYSQYAKFDIDFSKSFLIDERNSIALHAAFGIAIPYGNSDIVPYEKRYFSGGANSVRGWSVRELGPGSYAGKDGKIDFIQQTGNIKLDFSVEYRTVLLGKLHGAVFVDAGNIWNTRHYADQPGGQFHFDTFYRQIAAAYGVGLRLNLDYFVIRLDGGMKAINPAATGKAHYPIVRPRFSRDFTFHFAVGMPF